MSTIFLYDFVLFSYFMKMLKLKRLGVAAEMQFVEFEFSLKNVKIQMWQAVVEY